MAKSDSGRETGNPLARRLERFARRLETETYTLYLAYKDSRTPWYARAWSALIVAYTLSPIDLIPDFIPVRGYLSSDEPVLHFGLGKATTIDALTVTWPDGVVQTLTNLAVNHLHTITKPAGAKPANPSRAPTRARFEEAAQALELTFRHHDPPFDDYAREPLLPWQLSSLGPGLAWGLSGRTQ